MAKIDTHHPALGTLHWHEPAEWWEVNVEFQASHPITLFLSADKEYHVFAPLDELVAAGVKYLDWAKEAQTRCREQIADDLLECYNRAWAHSYPDREAKNSQPHRLPKKHKALMHTTPPGRWWSLELR